MYLDIFYPMRWMKILSILGAILTVNFYSGLFLAKIILITPLHGQTWAEIPLKNRSLALAIPQASVGIAIDLCLLISAKLAISKLQITPERRMGINIIFMGGFK